MAVRCHCGIKDCHPSAVVTPGTDGAVTWLKAKYSVNFGGQGFKTPGRAGNGVKKNPRMKGTVWPGMNLGYNPTRRRRGQ